MEYENMPKSSNIEDGVDNAVGGGAADLASAPSLLFSR